jgi:hypothetical protein
MGAKKKLVARISKSEPLILKSKPLIFFPLKTRFKTTPKTRTKKGSALVQSSLRVLECQLFAGLYAS